MQWLNSSASFDLDETGTNNLLITPASYSPQDNPKYSEVTIALSDDTVATVEYEEAPSDGVLTYTVSPLAEGTTTVTATLGELTASFTLEVTGTPIEEGIEFSEDSLSLERIESTTIQVLSLPSQEPITGLTITTSDGFLVNAIEDEDNHGTYNVYASGTTVGGTATLTATYDGHTATCTVTVSVPTLESFTIDYDDVSTPLEVEIGDTQTIGISMTPYNAVMLPADYTGTASASAEGKATFTLEVDSVDGYIVGVNVEGIAEATGLTYTLTNNENSSLTDTTYVNVITPQI